MLVDFFATLGVPSLVYAALESEGVFGCFFYEYLMADWDYYPLIFP
jgi:hypothetical protein